MNDTITELTYDEISEVNGGCEAFCWFVIGVIAGPPIGGAIDLSLIHI